MKFSEKFDNSVAGAISGVFLPLVVGLTIYLFTAGGVSIASYLHRISVSNIVTHAITLCVFPNVLIFLLFNRYDMLRASKGVLAVTILWAIIVFAVKFFG
jgi:hypothetical protein